MTAKVESIQELSFRLQIQIQLELLSLFKNISFLMSIFYVKNELNSSEIDPRL
jgi:hypothetical protein